TDLPPASRHAREILEHGYFDLTVRQRRHTPLLQAVEDPECALDAPGRQVPAGHARCVRLWTRHRRLFRRGVGIIPVQERTEDPRADIFRGTVLAETVEGDE